MRLILLGLPGVGKGTQAKILAQRQGLLHISTGAMFREAAAAGASGIKAMQASIAKEGNDLKKKELQLKIDEAQAVLEELDPNRRLIIVNDFLHGTYPVYEKSFYYSGHISIMRKSCEC